MNSSVSSQTFVFVIISYLRSFLTRAVGTFLVSSFCSFFIHSFIHFHSFIAESEYVCVVLVFFLSPYAFDVVKFLCRAFPLFVALRSTTRTNVIARSVFRSLLTNNERPTEKGVAAVEGRRLFLGREHAIKNPPR